jgi:hypothetical protein
MNFLDYPGAVADDINFVSSLKTYGIEGENILQGQLLLQAATPYYQDLTQSELGYDATEKRWNLHQFRT